MIDPDEHDRSSGRYSQRLTPEAKTFPSGAEAILGLSEEDIMTCRHILPGYSLDAKSEPLFSC